MLESGPVTDVVAQGWWVPLIGTLATVVAAVLTYTLKRLADKLLEKMKATDAEKEAMQCLLEGMAKSQESIVREAKKAASDGKLSKEEIQQAKDCAIAHALSVAKGPALEVLKTMGTERLGSIIKQLLAKLSSNKEK